MDEADFWRECEEKADMMTDSEVEEYLDGCWSRTQRTSPPATPPPGHDQQQTPGAHELERQHTSKRVSRKAPRRPRTRSQGHDMVALLPKKGLVRYWTLPLSNMPYETYLRDFVSGRGQAHDRATADTLRRIAKSC